MEFRAKWKWIRILNYFFNKEQFGQNQSFSGTSISLTHSIWNHLIWHRTFSQKIICANDPFLQMHHWDLAAGTGTWLLFRLEFDVPGKKLPLVFIFSMYRKYFYFDALGYFDKKNIPWKNVLPNIERYSVFGVFKDNVKSKKSPNKYLRCIVFDRSCRRAGFGVWKVCRLCTIRAGNSCFVMLMPKILRLCPTDRVILCGNGCVGSKYTWKCGSTWASMFLFDLVCGAILWTAGVCNDQKIVNKVNQRVYRTCALRKG